MAFKEFIEKTKVALRLIKDDDIYAYDPRTNEVHIRTGLVVYLIPSNDVGYELYEITSTTNIENLNKYRAYNRVFIENKELKLF